MPASLTRAKTMFTNGTLDPRIERALRHAQPDVFDDKNTLFLARARRIGEHRATHGTRPPKESMTAEQAADWKWFDNTRMHRAALPEWKRAILDSACPGWDDVPVRAVSAKWHPALGRHSAWVRSAGRPPRFDLSEADELAAFQWFYQQSRRLAADDPRRDEIAAVTPDWDRDRGFPSTRR